VVPFSPPTLWRHLLVYHFFCRLATGNWRLLKFFAVRKKGLLFTRYCSASSRPVKLLTVRSYSPRNRLRLITIRAVFTLRMSKHSIVSNIEHRTSNIELTVRSYSPRNRLRLIVWRAWALTWLFYTGNLNVMVTSPVSWLILICWFSKPNSLPVDILNSPARNCMPLVITCSNSAVFDSLALRVVFFAP